MDEFLINTTTTGDQDQPGIAGLQGLQFVAVWADKSTQDIKGRQFGVNGAATSKEFNINFPQKAGTKRQLPTIIETGLGFAVAWIETLPGARPQLKLRTFDADTLSGPETEVSSAEVEPLIRPGMARLSDGSFVVVWADIRANERVRAQRFEADGTKRGTEFRANTAPGLHRFPVVAGLANGNFVIAWRARLPGPLLVRLQMFGATGPVGAEQVTSLDVTEIAIAPFDSGGFAIAHLRSALDGETGFDTTIVQLNIFDASAKFLSRFAATTGTGIQSSWPTLATLPGGRVLLAWTQTTTGSTTGTNVHARIFSTKGAVGKVTQVNTLRGGSRFSLSAATTSGPGGDTAFLSWVDDSNAGPDKTGRAIEGRVLPVPAAGF